MRDSYYLLLLFFVLANGVFGQEFDNCEEAFIISNPKQFCTEDGYFNLANATPSGFGNGSCFEGNENDVWVSFRAVARDVTFIAQGDVPNNSTGTLKFISMALYSGDCNGTLSLLSCAPGMNRGITELYEGGLDIGREYYLRIRSTDEELGTFSICIKNYNPSQKPESDCADAAFICSKEPIVIQKVEGGGVDNSELTGATCSLGEEESSTWFTFVCRQSGTLEFTITPLSEIDDLDFILFELPHGKGDCRDKKSLRCMAAGESPNLFPSPCHGATGLREGETDRNEEPGCDNNQNNFLSPVDIVSGTTYALVINNFTSTGNGLEIEWGGTGTFQGPDPEIEVRNNDDKVCLSESIEFVVTNANDMDDAIIKWQWFFGEDARPASANGIGPHVVSFERGGKKNILVQMESAIGCINTQEILLEVECCGEDLRIKIKGDINVALGEYSHVSSEVSLKGNEYEYMWSPPDDVECPSCSKTRILPKKNGSVYVLTVMDEFGCVVIDSITFNVKVAYPIYTPTAFSPNSDGVNDVYRVFFQQSVENIQRLSIFNKWGECVYEVTNISPKNQFIGWDGFYKDMPANEGTYTLDLQIRFIDDHVVNYTGTIQLLR